MKEIVVKFHFDNWRSMHSIDPDTLPNQPIHKIPTRPILIGSVVPTHIIETRDLPFKLFSYDRQLTLEYMQYNRMITVIHELG